MWQRSVGYTCRQVKTVLFIFQVCPSNAGRRGKREVNTPYGFVNKNVLWEFWKERHMQKKWAYAVKSEKVWKGHRKRSDGNIRRIFLLKKLLKMSIRKGRTHFWSVKICSFSPSIENLLRPPMRASVMLHARRLGIQFTCFHSIYQNSGWIVVFTSMRLDCVSIKED